MNRPWWRRLLAAICAPRHALRYGPTERGPSPVTHWPAGLLGEEPPTVTGAASTWGLESGRRVDEKLGGDGWGFTRTPPHYDPHDRDMR